MTSEPSILQKVKDLMDTGLTDFSVQLDDFNCLRREAQWLRTGDAHKALAEYFKCEVHLYHRFDTFTEELRFVIKVPSSLRAVAPDLVSIPELSMNPSPKLLSARSTGGEDQVIDLTSLPPPSSDSADRSPPADG